jgi:hypothetical protein
MLRRNRVSNEMNEIMEAESWCTPDIVSSEADSMRIIFCTNARSLLFFD